MRKGESKIQKEGREGKLWGCGWLRVSLSGIYSCKPTEPHLLHF
jgi:hypothetical protein